MLVSSAIVAVAIFVMIVSLGDVSVLALGFVFGFAYLLALALVGIVLLLGLPLKPERPAGIWWSAHSWVSWAVAALGFFLFIVSRLVFATSKLWTDDEGFLYESFAPQPVMAIIGIVALAFGLVHLRWSDRLNEPVFGAVKR